MNQLDKNLYKIFITTIKYVPTLLAMTKILSLALSYFKITSFALTCVGGTSIILLVILYLISYIFKFCGLYRLSLNYVSLITGISILDWYFNLPVCIGSYPMYFALTGLFIIAWIVYWYKNRHNPKVDYIKRLCDTYSDCNC